MVRHGYAKDPVGAHYGTGNWIVQRMSALVMAVYIVIAVPYAICRAPTSYGDWQALFSGGFFRLATLLFFLALAWHAWIGVRDILLDYVHHYGMRLATQSAAAIALVFYVIWSFAILWGH